MVFLPSYLLKNSFSPQTLFKLHLRTEQQAYQSKIYRKCFAQGEIKNLVNDFKRRASQALFFIPIKRIMASYPSQHTQHQESWAVEKSGDNLPGFSGVLRILHPSSPPNQWSVLFKTVPLLDIPSNFHECLSIHKIQTVSIGIAGALDKQPIHYRSFFGVPLLETISLPIHLHCTFILSDDRRSIRYDEKGSGNLESQFNKWLLTEKVPLLYLQFLADWNHAHPMKECPWWPRKIGTDTISQAVFKGMETILPTSDELVCDTHSGHRIAPSKSHFLQPLCPKGLLLALLPEDLAIIPPGFSHLSSPPLQNVDNHYLTTILRNGAGSIISMYKEGRITVGDIVGVAGFLTPLPDFIGLPLLPLADGTLSTISTEHTTFYCPPQEHDKPWLPFPPHHFLDPKAATERVIYDPLQVSELDSMAISRLIMEKIPKQDTFISSPELELWFKELWKLLSVTPNIQIEDSVFQQLPLIPTYSPGNPTRISFQRLTKSDVLLVGSRTDVPLDACAALGMRLIKAEDCRRKLREAIESHNQRQGIHRTIIGFFKDLPLHQIPDRFQRLDYKLHSEFSQWFRDQLSGNYRSLPDGEKAIVQYLPLWEAVQVGLKPAEFVSASTALVIPERVNPNVVRMWTTASTAYVPTDHLLSLMKEPITLPTFYTNHLSFPLVMTTVTPTYRSLLREVFRSRPQPSILVPNANGRMSSSSELYLSSNTTFAAAFASQNKAFLHPDLRDLEQELCSWGLISTITVSSFKACASAISQDMDIHRTSIMPRAQTVFRTYNSEMPNKLLGDYGSQNALRTIRFIPRRTGSTRYGYIPTDRYHSLPNIVSPNEILDPEFVRVAWTQRAECLEEPSPNLLLVNKSIWGPGVSEVVRAPFVRSATHLTHYFQIKHLRILSTQIAPDLRRNSELIEDLKATYSWLADHKSEAGELLEYNQETLFLNVDNPDSEWEWNSASELLFDERDSSNPRRVKRFLRDYSELLRAAGVREISHVSIPDNLMREDSHETQLTRIRSSFNSMREQDQLTDVTFVAEDGTKFSAHRVFLAAQSRHFKTCFAQVVWRESRILEEKVEIPVEHGRESLQAVLGSWSRFLKSRYAILRNYDCSHRLDLQGILRSAGGGEGEIERP